MSRLVAAAVALTSCSRPAPPRVERLAILRFDNLTGDASLDWLASAAPAVLAHELTGGDRPFPTLAENLRDAYLQREMQFAHGYFENRGSALRFYVAIEDAAGHKLVREDSAVGGPLDALSGIARRIDAHPRAFSTANQDALAAWGHADFERAVTLDPDFGTAWLSWVQTLAARGDSAQARDVAARALQRGSLRSDLERVQIQALAAGLRQDEPARIAALEELARLAPFEPAPLRTLAQTDMIYRRFAEAARVYENLIRADPGDPAATNMLGYAQALAGDPDQARASFEQYGKQPGQAVNALDSLGEAMFLNGRFREAEKAFLECYQKGPAFLEGRALWKAAHARWLGGDLQGADELMARYAQARIRARDPFIAWRQATWLYETGRREQAIALLNQTPGAEVTERQLAVWSNPDAAIPHQIAPLQQLYEKTEPVNDGLPRIFYARALFEAGKKDQARKLIALWPLPPRADLPVESLVYPEFLELKKALQ